MSESEETMTITLKIPKRLANVIEAAAREIDITHGTIPEREALCLHLLERGARSVAAYNCSEDFRPVSAVSVAELADLLGIASLEGARRSARDAHAAHHKAIDAALALFNDCEGLRHVGTKHRCTSAKEIVDLAESIAGVMKTQPTLAIVLAFAYVDTSKSVPSYTPVVLPETVN